MSDAVARIPPDLLAAALRELDLGDIDVSTEEGSQIVAQRVSDLLRDEAGTHRLLDALQDLASARPENSTAAHAHYDRAQDAESTPSRHHPDLDEPPIGSREFREFVRRSSGEHAVVQIDLKTDRLVTLAKPSALGFSEDEVRSPDSDAARSFYDIFSSVQDQLSKQLPAQQGSLFARLRSLLGTDTANQRWRVVTRVVAKNYVVVVVTRGEARVQLKSIASGNDLFVVVVADGKQTLREKLSATQSDLARTLLAKAFAFEREAGAETLQHWRESFLIDTEVNTFIR